MHVEGAVRAPRMQSAVLYAVKGELGHAVDNSSCLFASCSSVRCSC